MSAAVLVRKGSTHRLTCSWHYWEEHDGKYPNLLGQENEEAQRVFRVMQGEGGTDVGQIVERVGKTDIALAKLHDSVTFENTFMDINAVAKRFVHSKEVEYFDEFLIDSFSTGKQKLTSLGRRWQIARKAGQPHPDLVAPGGDESMLPSDEVAYVSAVQGVCGTSDPTLLSKPYIRDSTCGAILLRCRMGMARERPEKEVLARGEICGMLHYPDLTARNTANGIVISDIYRHLRSPY
jgi:hypothetical protein